jgi:hypothetical protein
LAATSYSVKELPQPTNIRELPPSSAREAPYTATRFVCQELIFITTKILGLNLQSKSFSFATTKPF